MTKVLGEAMLGIEREKLRECKVIGLQRDEADGRMWFRYRAVTPDLALIQGVLGHERKECKGARGVLMATDKVFEHFCTPGRVLGKDNAKMDRRLYSHFRRRLEMVNVDSDGKELLAASMMREQVFKDNHGVEELAGKPLTPNMRLTLRDATHASRRRRLHGRAHNMQCPRCARAMQMLRSTSWRQNVIESTCAHPTSISHMNIHMSHANACRKGTPL
jgi:hypothetical protein